MTSRPKQLVLIRHGQSEFNVAKREATYFADEYARRILEGRADSQIGLTALGIEQSKRTGQGLREQFGTFDYIFHSGYQRAKQTLDNILLAYTPSELDKMPTRMDVFLRERDPGFTYAMTESEVDLNFPWLNRYWKTFGDFLSHPPGGESLGSVSERVHLFLNMIFSSHSDEKILVVTHAHVIRCFRFLLEHWNYEQAFTVLDKDKPRNCGVSSYHSDSTGQRMILSNYNVDFTGGLREPSHTIKILL